MRRTILLADDSPTIQRLVTSTFAGGDYELISVSNGEAAVRKIEEIHPHVVLADIYMPGKNGYEVCQYVRNHPLLSDTPVILLVGAFDAFDEEKARQIGATANITKPFEPHALIAMVESVLPSSDVHLYEEAVEIIQAPAPAPAPAPVPTPAPRSEPVAAPAPVPERAPVPDPVPVPDPAPAPVLASQGDGIVAPEEDILGLALLFQEPVPDPASASAAVTEEDIDRIADRVIQRLSAQVVENIAWEIVPDIAEKIVREESKRINER